MSVIRRFKPDDMFAVVKLAFETLTERYNPTIFNYFYETFPQGFLVAEQYHQLIGFIVTVPTQTSGKILMLSVKESFRRQNIGSTLLSQIKQVLCDENIHRLELEVNAKNDSAIQFYQKHGFVITEKIPNFYTTGDDALIMTISC